MKIGGSVITHKDSDTPRINHSEIRRVCKEIKEGLKNKLILIHGAGSYGHVIVKKTRIHEGIKNKKQLVSFAETQRLQNELNSLFCKELIKNNIPAIPVQASSSALMKNNELVSMNINVVKELLNLGMVPVLYGVPAYDEEKGCSILSGDRIITYLGKELGADRIIHATNVDGVYDKNPKKHSDARIIKEISSIKELSITSSDNTDVTGGMEGKVNKLLELRTESEIINGKTPGNIKKALSGIKGLGTIIKNKK